MKYKLLTALFFMLLPLTVFADQLTPSEQGYKLEADTIQGAVGGSYQARGNVRLTFGNSEVRADEAVYYPETKILEAVGNIAVKDNIQELRADRVTYDLAAGTGTAENVTGFINGEYYVCAAEVHQTGPESFTMEGARVTTCSSPIPAWSFSFHTLEAEIDGYLFGDHATMNIRDIPVLYSPKLFFPLKIERQTGFMIPSLGASNTLGTYFNQDFFWAIDYDKDITLGANYFSYRGFQGVAEGRYTISDNSNVYLAGDFANDSRSPVEENNRWRYVSKSLVTLPLGFEIMADADAVSDYMYIREYGEFSIFDNGQQNHENVFYEQYQLKWESRFLDALVFYRESSKFKDTDTGYIKTTIYQQPSLSLEKYNIYNDIVNIDYKLSVDNVKHSTYTHYDNSPFTESINKYTRYFGEISLYRSINTPVFSITPTISANYTSWQNFSYDVNANEDKQSPFMFIQPTGNGVSRFIPEFNVKMVMNEIYRYYGDYRHGILNTFEYGYIQELDQAGLPNYLEDDIIDRRNEFAWQFKTYFSKSIFRGEVTLKQAADFNLSNYFLPLDLKAQFSISSFFSNTFAMNYDYYADSASLRSDSPFTYLSNLASFSYGPYSFYANYTFNNTLINNYNISLRLGGGLRIGKLDLNGWIQWQANNDVIGFYGLTPMENRVSAVWNAQCWNFGLSFHSKRYIDITNEGRSEKRDYTVELIIGLKGLGYSNFRAYNNLVY